MVTRCRLFRNALNLAASDRNGDASRKRSDRSHGRRQLRRFRDAMNVDCATINIKFIGYVAMAKQLTEWPNGSETPWLKDLDRAYKNFFAKRAAFPKFTFPDGKYLAPLASFKTHEMRLARYQRAMSNKQKFSKNWHKAKRGVQNTHARIADARRDYLHKATTAFGQNYAMVTCRSKT